MTVNPKIAANFRTMTCNGVHLSNSQLKSVCEALLQIFMEVTVRCNFHEVNPANGFKNAPPM